MNAEILTGSLVAAVGLIGTLVAWLGHRVIRSNAELSAQISRESAKLTTSLEAAKQLAYNRQEWINKLREDMATYFALTIKNNRSNDEHGRVFEVGSRIELRMNPNDSEYARLRKSMLSCTILDDEEHMSSGREEYISVCQSILKKEWETLKSELRELPYHRSEN